jgi:hypothetical protein
MRSDDSLPTPPPVGNRTAEEDMRQFFTRTMQNSNHWLEKLAGPRMSSSWGALLCPGAG